MTIGIIGATGFTGQYIARSAAAVGHHVIGYSRSQQSADTTVREWRSSEGELDFQGVDAVICVAGHSVDRRWTEENMQLFQSSRVGMTERIVETLAAMPEGVRPKVFVNASAVGIYGDGGDVILDENGPEGEGYLADLCRDWEAASIKAESYGVRVAMMRIGMVLGKGGGAYEKLVRVFKCGIGGKLGNGQQWVPWVHVEDLASAFLFTVENTAVKGPVNMMAPEPVRNVEFTKLLAKSLSRFAILPVPGFVLELVLGGFGAVLLFSQRAIPKVLEDAGFEFFFKTLDAALDDLVERPSQ